MGQGIIVSCMYCDYEEELLEGVGMLSNLIDIDMLIKDSKTKEEKERLINLKRKFNAKVKDVVSYKYFECTNCETLYSIECYELILSNNEIYKKEAICPVCNKPLKALDSNEGLNLEKYRCKKCNMKGFSSFFGEIKWD